MWKIFKCYISPLSNKQVSLLCLSDRREQLYILFTPALLYILKNDCGNDNAKFIPDCYVLCGHGQIINLYKSYLLLYKIQWLLKGYLRPFSAITISLTIQWSCLNSESQILNIFFHEFYLYFEICYFTH